MDADDNNKFRLERVKVGKKDSRFGAHDKDHRSHRNPVGELSVYTVVDTGATGTITSERNFNYLCHLAAMLKFKGASLTIVQETEKVQ